MTTTDLATGLPYGCAGWRHCNCWCHDDGLLCEACTGREETG